MRRMLPPDCFRRLQQAPEIDPTRVFPSGRKTIAQTTISRLRKRPSKRQPRDQECLPATCTHAKEANVNPVSITLSGHRAVEPHRRKQPGSVSWITISFRPTSRAGSRATATLSLHPRIPDRCRPVCPWRCVLRAGQAASTAAPNRPPWPRLPPSGWWQV